MKRILALSSLALLALTAGCDQKDQDNAMAQGRTAMSKAADFASGAWKSACEKANKLTEDSGKPALESAKAQLEAARDKLSKIKTPTSVDDLKLDSVKGQIDRLEAALSVQKLKAEMNARVDDAMKAKDNAVKTVDDAKAKLEAADAQYRGLQRKLDAAQSAYDSASEKVKEASQRIQKL